MQLLPKSRTTETGASELVPGRADPCSLLVPLVIALVPLLITPGLLSSFDITPKIAVLLWGAALMSLYPRSNASNLRTLVKTSYGRTFLILIAAEWLTAAAASAFSSYPSISLHGGTWRRYGLLTETGLLLFVLLAAGWLTRDPNHLRPLLRASTLAGALAAIYGVAQYFGRDPFLPSSAYEVGEEPFRIVRPPGTLGHADYFAGWLVAVVFLAVALSALETTRRLKNAAFMASLIAAFAILLTGTRAALLGLAAGALMMFLAKGLRVRQVALGLACTVAVLAFFLAPTGARLRARLHWSIEDARGGARLLLWRDSLQMAAHRPVSGFGLETFSTEFPRFESVELARSYPDFYHESPHNIFLDALASEGFIGLAALLALCGLGAWAAVKAWRSGHPLAAPLAAAFVGMLVSEQFVSFVLATSLYFHLLIAMLVVLVVPRKNTASASTAAWQWIFPLSLAVSIVLLLFTTHLVFADRALAVVEKRIASNDAGGAAAAYGAVLAWQMPGAGADLAYSRAMQELANRTATPAVKMVAAQQALESGLRAITSAEDRQNAWYNLAILLATRNDPAGVEHALRNAIAWAPNWFKPHWTLAQFLELTNRREEALAEARIALELDGNHDPEVAATWKKLQEQAH